MITMGLLDDLRKQSTDLKNTHADSAAKQAELLEIYKTKIHPAMTSIYTHVNEVLEHLNFVKPTIMAAYTLTASGIKRDLKQHSYNINTDSSDEMKQIILTFYCTDVDNIEFEVENKKNVEKHIEYLQRHKLQYTSQQYRDDSHEVASAKFNLESKVKVTILIQGDVQNSCIHLNFNNFQGLGLLKRDIQAEQVTEDFLDEMGKYLIRESNDFMKLDLSAQDRKRLQQKIKKEQLQRRMEIIEIEKKRKEEIEAEKTKKKPLFGFLDKNK